jgi:hypothetical protein
MSHRGSHLDSQLNDQAVVFLKNPQNLRLNSQAGKVHLSSIFKWFGEDFINNYSGKKEFKNYGDKEGAVMNFISLYLDEKDSKALISQNSSIEYLDYDWSLNERKK